MSLLTELTRQASSLGSRCRRALVGADKIAAGTLHGWKFDAGSDTDHFLHGQYEQPVQEAIGQYVQPGDTCYDIGANFGFMTLLCARLAGSSGAVYAFEPVPRNAQTIRRNAAMNKLANITVFQLALSSSNGSGELLLAEHAGGAVLQTVGVPPPDLAGSLRVQTAALDALVADLDLRAPDFIKLDVEGAELDVLRGMGELLRKSRPAILIETDDAVKVACERKMAECAAYLQPMGYVLEPIPNSYRDGAWFVRHAIARVAGGDGR